MGSTVIPHLLYSDGSPTPFFSQLCLVLHSQLDSSRTGSIYPEDYSSFLDLLGIPTHNNVWKRNFKQVCGHSPDSNADAEFRIFLDNFEIPYSLGARISRPPLKRSSTAGSGSTNSSVLSFSSNSSPLPSPGLNAQSYGEMMPPVRRTSSATAAARVGAVIPKTPLIPLDAFTNLLALEFAQRPGRGGEGLNRALAHYRISAGGYKQLPREALPAAPLEATTRRVSDTAARTRQKADAFLAASSARVQRKGSMPTSPVGYG